MARQILLLLLTAVLLAGLAACREQVGDPQSDALGRTVLPLSAAVALLVFAATGRGPWKHSGAWLALAIVGQAMALQLIDAGRRLHYQHYRLDPRSLQPEEWPLLLGIIAQAAFVLPAWKGRVASAARWLRREAAPLKLAAAAMVFSATSAALSPQWTTYLGELVLATAIQLLNLLTVLLVARDAPTHSLRSVREYLEETAGPPGAARARRVVSWLPWVVALWVSGLAALLSLAVYEAHPHVPDEVAYFLQARYFAEGRLFLEAPPVPEAFEIYCVFHSGDRWFSVFPPGWPAMLAAGMALGAGWLVNPLLGGLGVLLAYALAREVWGRAAATILILLIAVSPWYIFVAMSLMSHTLALTAALLSLWGLVRARRSGRARWAAVSGLGLGVLALTRPFDAVLLLLLVGVAAAWPGRRRLSPRSGLALFVSVLAMTSVLLLYNRELTGNPLSFPADLYYEETFGPGRYGIGFGPERGFGWAIDAFPGHGPLEALVNTALNLFSVNVDLLGWSSGSLLMILALVALGRLSARDCFLLLSIGTIIAGYGLFWYHGGPDFGARYWFLIIVPCLILTVRGAQEVSLALGGSGVAEPGGRVAVVLVAFCVMAATNYFPWRTVDKYWHFLDMSPHLREAVDPGAEETALVLVKGAPHPDYASAAVLNPLDWSSPATLYARDLESSNRLLVESYPDRRVWRVEGPSVTGGGYRIAGRPEK